MLTYSFIRATHEQVISRSPAIVGAIILTSDAGGNADVTFYDGESASDEELMTVRASQYVTNEVLMQPYLKTRKGLYVNIGSNVSEVIILLGIERE